ncbi:phage holin family protein [Clostridium algoriphilum]|uniref:phage holin family protein n=1 Tax=Clostridium algoriphilum TaxID=198347 RepID=UPI001CF4D82F|nr:phage holin family protein [Clostridium algoriphilum]MCB2296072.1 phage holin family protein [Clostridium algoriphilum]
MKKEEKKKGAVSILTSLIIRFVVTSVILAITSFLIPGFVIKGLGSIILAAIVISLLDYAVEKVMGVDASPFGKGLKGFVISAIILYIAQYLVPGMGVSIIGAIIAAIFIGILDAIIPGRVM